MHELFEHVQHPRRGAIVHIPLTPELAAWVLLTCFVSAKATPEPEAHHGCQPAAGYVERQSPEEMLLEAEPACDERPAELGTGDPTQIYNDLMP